MAMTGLLSLKWNNHCLAFLHLLENLHAKQTYSDVTIVCQNKYYPVHRLVLSTCSEYFEDIFEQIQCKHPFIVLKDILPEEFEALLNYMYKGVVNVVQECLPGLIKAAEALKIKGLAVSDDIFSRDNDNDGRSSSSSPSAKKLRIDDDREDGKEEKEENNTEEGTPRVEPSPEELIMEAPDAEDKKFTNIKTEPEESGDHIKDPETKDISSNSFNFDSEHLNDDYFPEDFGLQSAGINDDSFSTDMTVGQTPLPQWRGPGTSMDPADTSGLIQYCVLGATNSSISNLDSNSYILKKGITTCIEGGTTSKVREYSIYQCQHCSYQTKYKAHLLVHVRRRHTGERPFVCPYCDYKSAAKETLTLHLRKHTGYKPHRCTHCSYSSAHKCNLLSHIKRHTGDKPFVCQLCPYRAAQSSQLKRHMKVHDK